MTIEQIRSEKQKLEKKVAGVLKEFHVKTGAEVSKIDVKATSRSSRDGTFIFYSVSCTVNL